MNRKRPKVKKSILLRVYFAFALAVVAAALVAGRLVILQTVEGDRWRRQAKLNTVQNRYVKATRGNIYADDGSLLATSLPFFRVAFDPTVADRLLFSAKVDSLGLLLSDFFEDHSAAYYTRRLRRARAEGREFVYLNRKLINHVEKQEMSQWPLFREGQMRGGIIFEKVDRRFRPFRSLAGRTVGYMREDVGAGLEYSFNEALAGRDGRALYQKIAGNLWKPVYDGSEIKPEAGYDIQTTINVNLQDVAHSALERALKKHNANYGCVVLMEVQTGEIKVMANLDRLASGEYAERYNYAVGDRGRTDPGSTFKLASYLALFEETDLQLSDTIDTGEGAFTFKNNVLKDARRGGYGVLTVQEAFEKSSNIAVARLVQRHFGQQPEEFVSYLEEFGLTKPLNFQMVGEGVPYVKRPSDPTWSGITLPWMSVGYEMQLTPLHVLTFYNAVANGGRMIQPLIVQEVRRSDRVVERFEPRVIDRRICSERSLALVKQMLVGVVERGTAANIRGTAYQIAGKTGTTQKIKDGRYTRSYYTSFAGFFPAHQPRYSGIVVIDDPQGKLQYGSDVAAPVFKEIADKVYSLDLGIHPEMATRDPRPGIFPVIQAGFHPDMHLVCDEIGIENHLAKRTATDWVRARPVGDTIRWQPRPVAEGLMPNLRGMMLRDVLYLLENRRVQVKYQGEGRVAWQSPAVGDRLRPGSAVSITLE